MSTTSQIRVSDLRSATEVGGAIAERRAGTAAAERFIGQRFGEEALWAMLRIKETVDGRPTFVFCRQIAKPDLQHNAIYLTAKSLDYSMLTPEWHSDFLTMKRGYYKRTYAKLPLAAMGRNGMYIRNISLVDEPLYGTRLRDAVVSESAVGGFVDVVRRIEPEIAGALELREHTLPEFHQRLREIIEGKEQLTVDTSRLGEHVAGHILRNKFHVPGIEATVHRMEDGEMRIETVGGQMMNIIVFAMQNMIPNMLLAVTDWNHDDLEIRRRYQIGVEFLKQNGLKAPLQIFMPSLADKLKGQATSSIVELDYITPAITGLDEIPRPKSDGSIGATYIAMGSAILSHMMRKR